MIESSDKYSDVEAIEILFKNFTRSVPDTRALLVMDMENDKTIAAYTSEGEEERSLMVASRSIKRILDRLTKQLITGSGPVSFFDTDQNRLIFIKVKTFIFCVVLKIEGSVDNALPYAYLTAEKVCSILEDRAVELDIPLIKIITDEEEQRRIREHFFELRASKGTFTFKLIVIGDENVGKTSLILRHAEDKFKNDYLPTLGVSITTNFVELPIRKTKVNFSTWDFGGQKYFRRVRLSYYAGAQACFVVFDLTNKASFEKVKMWNEERLKFSGDIITILIGNKSDLPEERQVSQQEAIELANKLGVSYFETSALTGANVHDVFNLLAYKLVDQETRKVERNELMELKSELLSMTEDSESEIKFGLIYNRKYFSPILQVFLEIDPNPIVRTLEIAKEYKFNYGLTLITTEISDKNYFSRQLELLKNIEGIIGIYDSRLNKSTDDAKSFAMFMKLLFKESTNKDFTGSIGILCKNELYSDYLNVFDLSQVLGVPSNSDKSIFFYKLSDNYMLEILDNLKMFFTSYNLL
ncbi:MAG: Rab family GTPase [Promethearchaeota archaeon]